LRRREAIATYRGWLTTADASRLPWCRPAAGRVGRFGWLVMTVLALGVGAVSVRYLVPGMPGAFAEQAEVFRDNAVWFRLHVAGGVVALALGPWQFLRRLRESRPRIHRWTGRLYLTAVGVGSAGGFYMAWLSWGGAVAHAGFVLLALSWALSSLMAYRSARARDFTAHRRWMIRSYALTFAAVTRRLWLPLLGGAGVPLFEAYAAVAWLAWVPDLVAVEVYHAVRHAPAGPSSSRR